MKKISVQQALSNAMEHSQKGELPAATKIYNEILKVSPGNKKAKVGLQRIINLQRSVIINEPDQIIIDRLMTFFKIGKLDEVIIETRKLLLTYKTSVSLWNILGIASSHISRFDDAIFAFERIIDLKPDEASAHYNLGNVMKDRGQIREAIFAFARAIKLKPDYVQANNNFNLALEQLEKSVNLAIEKRYDNLATNGAISVDFFLEMGNDLLEQGLLKQALKVFKKAIQNWPNCDAAYNNVGIVLFKQGLINEAETAFKKAISLNPNYFSAYNNLGNSYKSRGLLNKALSTYHKSLGVTENTEDHNLANEHILNLQLQLKIKLTTDFMFSRKAMKEKYLVEKVRPMFTVLHAINSFIDARKSDTQDYLENFKASTPEMLAKLDPKQKQFCSAYVSYLGSLLSEQPQLGFELSSDKYIYHIGESHCLSYAHHAVSVKGERFQVVPRITLGGKAFHFSVAKNNSFKAITKHNLASIPKASKVFVSFGEIDCRPNEGILSAASKLDKPIDEIVAGTVAKYLKWFNDQNRNYKHQLYFLNVPAPAYDIKFSENLNAEVAQVIRSFNDYMVRQIYRYNFNLIDVYAFTVAPGGYSNGKFHVDNRHLSAKAIPKIEEQINI